MNSTDTSTSILSKHYLRFDLGAAGATASWDAISQTPGIGVSITDSEGKLIFVNDTSQLLFSGGPAEYEGKTIADFHPPEFVRERLELITRVLKEAQPIRLNHIYLGNPIESTIWPMRDRLAPYNRVIVVSRKGLPNNLDTSGSNKIETLESKYIDLGPLDVLSKRELEVLVLLGHGMSIPRAASILHRSPKTIERHKTTIGKKLLLRGQSELVYIVTTMGLELSDTRKERLPT
jgi:DNA-binding CsgD family transcriptional regulator